MERADHLYGGLTEVACRICGGCVMVRKHSPQHTDIQWSAASVGKCLEFKGRPSASIPTCAGLSLSIEEAVHTGQLSVPLPVPPAVLPTRSPDG